MNNSPKVSSYFGAHTFGLQDMKDKLPEHAYKDLLKTIIQGRKLTSSAADQIAQTIKDWAVSKGATHFCHWFQPLNGLTAEKHDAFISVQHSDTAPLKVLERFSGNQLTQGEPDASSLPSGGARSTFEARGYTVWDPRSPLFLMQSAESFTLCIPSIFFSYSGEALDYKTPLLRSCSSLSQNMAQILKLLGDVDIKKVDVTIGAEQEYFLIDEKLVAQRPDLLVSGKTLLGRPPVKGQQLSDHYFGAIPSRVSKFMAELEKQLYLLGIPAKTRHNEVAPCQFELAPIFESAPIAADHNTLLMEVLKKLLESMVFTAFLTRNLLKT